MSVSASQISDSGASASASASGEKCICLVIACHGAFETPAQKFALNRYGDVYLLVKLLIHHLELQISLKQRMEMRRKI